MTNHFTTKNWTDYELLDYGNGKKLERFGEIVTVRPEMNANGPKKLSNKEWKRLAHAEFIEQKNQKGKWDFFKEVPDHWQINCPLSQGTITLDLKLTKFKHLGVFPEQKSNWDFIQESILKVNSENVNVLNLFAYTGGASLAARAAGATVTHVDSVKQVVNWSKNNMELSGLNDIRWIIDDALKFVQKEVRRGNKYHGIIMDPPAWGRGPKGEVWKLENLLGELLKNCSLLADNEFFMALNTYSGFDPSTLERLLNLHFPNRKFTSGTLSLSTTSGRLLPTGILNRIIN